jgi:hypothetical protein
MSTSIVRPRRSFIFTPGSSDVTGLVWGASDQFMNQHLLVKLRQRGTPHRCVANLGNSRAKAGPMSEANALGLTCDWRLDLDRSGDPAFSLRS